MSKVGDVAWKIIGGRKLTLADFKVALQDGMITGGMPKDERELAREYLYWSAGDYEDDDRYGRLCDKHPTRVIKEEEGKKTCCAYGIHMEEVNLDKLTKDNIGFLRHNFGKAKVKELTGK